MMPLDSLNSIHALLSSLLDALSKDAINGSFELAAGFFVLNHCRVLHAHKQVRGVSLSSVAFFTLWGVWNTYYYPALNQPISFYGGVFVVAANAFYLGMMWRYRNREIRKYPLVQINIENQISNSDKEIILRSIAEYHQQILVKENQS
jgi:hypothetical protein